MRSFAYLLAALWLASSWAWAGFIIAPYRFAAASGDPNFANVSLLLQLNGTNGSTSFPDASSAGRTVTGFGNAQISTAQSKWGGSSLVLDGSGDYLSVPDNAAFDFGTGDFTIEFWLRWNSLSGFQTIYSHGLVGAGDLLISTQSGTGRFAVAFSGSGILTESDALGTGVWGFYQFVRSGTTVRLYRDGVQKGTGTSGANLGSTSSLLIGSRPDGFQFNGWVQDVRITKGVARANVVPTAAFPKS